MWTIFAIPFSVSALTDDALGSIQGNQVFGLKEVDVNLNCEFGCCHIAFARRNNAGLEEWKPKQ